MTFDTPLALYTTLYGWAFYGSVWNIFLFTGIALVPFGFVIGRAFWDGFTQGSAVQVLPGVEGQIYTMLVIVAFAAQPSSFTNISPGTITVQAYARTITNPTPTPETIGTSTNTYAAAFGCPANASCGPGVGVDVPPFWYGVMKLSEGFTRATIAGLPEIDGLREIRESARLLNIADMSVRHEANRFFSECYVPAKSFYEQEGLDVIDSSDFWMGNRTFQSDARFYPTIRANKPVPGFPFVDSRDLEYDPQPTGPDRADKGMPSCTDWWTGAGMSPGGKGLREKLMDNVSASAGSSLSAQLVQALPSGFTLPGPFASINDYVDDQTVRNLLTRNPPTFTDDQILSERRNLASIPSDIARVQNTAFGRQDLQAVTDYIVIGAPMLQRILLLGVYGFLVFSIVGSGYRMGSLITGATMVFVLTYWSALFHMALWVEESLTEAFFPDGGRINALMNDFLFNNFSRMGSAIGIAQAPPAVGDSTKMTILSLLLCAGFVIFPLLFTTIVSSAGLRGAQLINGVMATSTASAISPAAGGMQRGTSQLMGRIGRQSTRAGVGAAKVGYKTAKLARRVRNVEVG